MNSKSIPIAMCLAAVQSSACGQGSARSADGRGASPDGRLTLPSGFKVDYFAHSDRAPNPEFNDAQRCANTIPPALELQAHSGPLGLTFLDNASAFPEEYRADALLALHGSWNRDEPTGAKVVRIHVDNGKPTKYEDFITGWQRPDRTRWGRPVDVLVYKDGSVLISDDPVGAIYRLYR